MLPWIFVVLLLLNAGLFFWGYQHEKSLEPPPTQVPEGRYEIRLLGEVPESQNKAAGVSREDVSEAGSGESVSKSPGEDAPGGVAPRNEDEKAVPPDTMGEVQAPVAAPDPESSREIVEVQAGADLPREDSGELSPDELEADRPAVPAEGSANPPPSPKEAE